MQRFFGHVAAGHLELPLVFNADGARIALDAEHQHVAQFLRNALIGRILVVLRGIEVDHLELSFGNGARFVGIEDVQAARGFRAVYFADQDVVLEQLFHVQARNQRNHHRQALGHRHHDYNNRERYGGDNVHNNLLPVAGRKIGGGAFHQRRIQKRRVDHKRHGD